MTKALQQPPIRQAADIEAIESSAYEEWVAGHSTYDLLRRAAEHRSAAPAVVFVQDAEDPASILTWSHADLVDRVERAAMLLRRLGVQRDQPVALLVPHIPSAQVALWGAQLAGCAFPINYLLNPQHIAQLLKAAGARVVIALDTAEGLSIRATALRAAELAGGIEHLLWIDPDERSPGPMSFQHRLMSETIGTDQKQAADGPLDDLPGADDLAALYHTGGTTGLPKLLRHTHANEVHVSRAATAYYEFGADDRVLNAFPLFHVAGAFVYGLSCLAAGGSLFIPTLTGLRNAAFMRSAWQWIKQLGVTHLGCVPTSLASLLSVPRPSGAGSQVRLALTGGSPLAPELALRFERETGIPVRSIFGMTECAGIVSIEPAGSSRVANSVGLRLPYTQIAAVALDDAAASRISCLLGPGEPGMIALRGPHVSPGYLDPAKNAGTFTDDGWLLSGDLGYVDAEGRVFLTGRAKDLIIRSSHNIDPGLIEDAFCAHPAVQSCAAVGEPDAYAGELPVVFVTLKPGAEMDGDALLSEVAPAIAEPPAVPRRVVVMEELPLTPVGKVFKPALRSLAAEQKVRVLLRQVGADGGGIVEASEAGGRVSVRVALMDSCPSELARQARAAVAELPISIVFD